MFSCFPPPSCQTLLEVMERCDTFRDTLSLYVNTCAEKTEELQKRKKKKEPIWVPIWFYSHSDICRQELPPPPPLHPILLSPSLSFWLSVVAQRRMNGGAPFSVDPVSGCQGISLVLMGYSLVSDSPCPAYSPHPDNMTHTHIHTRTHAYIHTLHTATPPIIPKGWSQLAGANKLITHSPWLLFTYQTKHYKEWGRETCEVEVVEHSFVLPTDHSHSSTWGMWSTLNAVTVPMRCRDCIFFSTELAAAFTINPHWIIIDCRGGNTIGGFLSLIKILLDCRSHMWPNYFVWAKGRSSLFRYTHVLVCTPTCSHPHTHSSCACLHG